MYFLEHGVNLSRRACRAALCVLCVVLVSYAQSSTETNTPAAETNRPADLHAPPADDSVVNNYGPYPGMKFGPMGPVDRDPNELVLSDLLKQEQPSNQPTAPTTAVAKPVERYKLINVEFERVETPFIIGLWIFCASLAKIGE